MSSADERIINRLQRIYEAQGAGGASFEELTGEPTDNAALGTALSGKVPTSRTVNGQELSGNVVVTGLMLDTAGAPANGVGANGDYAFDDATKTIYGPKAAGVWPAGVVLGAPAAPYLVYTALLTQAGTDAPVATVLQNTLGGTVVHAFVASGRFTATLNGAFTESKTTVLLTNNYNTTGIVLTGSRSTSDVIQLCSFSVSDGLPANGVMIGATLEIRVYP